MSDTTTLTQPKHKIPKLFSDAQTAELERNAEYLNYGQKHGKEVCPTCEGTGEYRLDGESYMCPVDEFGHVQLRLFKLYCLANIPYEFMTIPWGFFPHKIKSGIDRYLLDYDNTRREGLGYELYGSHGTGKTFAASHIGMEVAKMGYSVWFIQFAELKGLYEREPSEMHFNLKKIRESELLVIDEVTEPWSANMKEFYAEKLEDAVRFRAHRNFPTITTTNMTQDQWRAHYPRVHAQLTGKQLRVKFEGDDYRGRANDEANERAMNGERRPIV